MRGAKTINADYGICIASSHASEYMNGCGCHIDIESLSRSMKTEEARHS